MRFMTDTLAADEVKIKRTKEGFLVANPRIARTGIQNYRLDELADEDYATKVLGMDQYDPNQVIRVYHPESVVLSDEAMSSMTNMPVTINHPPKMVTADNWKDYAVGDTGEEVREDKQTNDEKKKGLKYIRVPMMLRDSQAIKLVEKRGVRELSVGYGIALDWTPGTDPVGNEYDASIKSIVGNHLAIVPKARGGSKLKIGDNHVPHHERKQIMDDTVQMVVDGISISVSQKDQQILDKHIKALQEALDAKTAEAKELNDKLTVKDGEIAALNKQVKDAAVTPEQLNQMVKDRQEIAETFEDVLGDREYATTEEMKRTVVTKYMGDEAVKDMKDEQVALIFDGIKATHDNDEGMKNKKKQKKAMDDSTKDSKTRTNPLLAPVKDTKANVIRPPFRTVGDGSVVSSKDAQDLLDAM